MTNESPNEDKFLEAYSRLAPQGKCDAPDGMKYRRVKGAWLEAGQPDDIDFFIICLANEPPDLIDLCMYDNPEQEPE